MFQAVDQQLVKRWREHQPQSSKKSATKLVRPTASPRPGILTKEPLASVCSVSAGAVGWVWLDWEREGEPGCRGEAGSSSSHPEMSVPRGSTPASSPSPAEARAGTPSPSRRLLQRARPVVSNTAAQHPSQTARQRQPRDPTGAKCNPSHPSRNETGPRWPIAVRATGEPETRCARGVA